MRKFALLRGLMTFDAVTRLASPRAQRSTSKGSMFARRASQEDQGFELKQNAASYFASSGFDHGRAKEFKGSGMGTDRQSALTVGLLKEGW